MQFIGLTGGIASGKSSIARRLAEHGAITLDADQLARLVVEPGWPALTQIVDAFGEEMLLADGSLNRAALGQHVFGDAARVRTLNSIVHPAIREHVAQVIRDLRAEHPNGVLVYEIPLLVESEHDYTWDLVVTAEAPDELRVQRMVELRGLSEAEARARLSHQATNAQRREIADIVIDTGGSLDETLAQTDALWARIQAGEWLSTGVHEG